MKNKLNWFIVILLLFSGCVVTDQRLKMLSEEATKADVMKAVGKSYDLYYVAKNPDDRITEVWDYRLFPYKGRYDHFKKSLDRDVGVVGSLGAALFFPPPDLGKETYRLYFKGDRLLKWEMLEGEPSEPIARNVLVKGSEEIDEPLAV